MDSWDVVAPISRRKNKVMKREDNDQSSVR